MADVNNLGAIIKDGKVQDATASANSLSKAKEKTTNSLDKDAFLTLLVTQMKYQDPLEPTDNTEYISQLANFSELEEMQNMVASNELSRASSLVGQSVILKVTNTTTGGTEVVSGQVDYVVYEKNKAYLSINDSLYSMDDVYEVVDDTYASAYDLAQKFMKALSNLPKVDDVTLENATAIKTLGTAYDSMTDYQKSFIDEETLEVLKKYVAKIHELELGAEANKKAEDADNNSEADDTLKA